MLFAASKIAIRNDLGKLANIFYRVVLFCSADIFSCKLTVNNKLLRISYVRHDIFEISSSIWFTHTLGTK